MKTGGQIVAEQLRAHGVKRLFCVPGESYLAVLDALLDTAEIDVITCRQEGGAAMMADAHAKLTGETGICFVTRGPGATNASAGVHVAAQDSTPMILFVGQVATEFLGREAFQEVDYAQFYGSIAKAVFQPMSAAEIAPNIVEAFRIAQSGRMGPVVVALPEDVLVEASDVWRELVDPDCPAPDAASIRQLVDMISRAERPFAILGGTGWTAKAVADFEKIAARLHLPVGCSFRRQMLFDHTHPNYAGDVGIGINPKLMSRIRQSDLVLLVGGRLGEMPSQGYTLLETPKPAQPLVHVHPDEREFGKVYEATLSIRSTPAAFVEAMGAAMIEGTAKASHVAEAHADYLAWSTPPETGPGALHMGPIMAWLEERLPDDAVLTNGAGNYATWVHRFHRFKRFATQAAPTSGSMGYGLPASVAAKRAFPERMVVCFAGDGCFLMHGQEFATAVHHGIPIIVIVVNNGAYGTIRMHQEREYPARVSATALTNPDFAALALAYGGHGETVTKTDEFSAAFERAVASGKPAIIELKLDIEAITPSRTLSQIRSGA